MKNPLRFASFVSLSLAAVAASAGPRHQIIDLGMAPGYTSGP